MVVMPSLDSTLTRPTTHSSAFLSGCYQPPILAASGVPIMQTRNPFLDDLAKVANSAMGALSGVKDEAVKAKAAKAREENGELKKQNAELQARLLNTGP